MNRFNQTKRALAFTMALMVGVCYMPAFAFATDSPKPADTDAKYKDTETRIDTELAAKVDYAQAAAEQAAKDADAALTAADAVGTADENAVTALNGVTGAANAVDAAAEQWKTDVANADKTFNGTETSKEGSKAGEVETYAGTLIAGVEAYKTAAENAKTAAQDAADLAAQAVKDAKLADTQEEAIAAAEKAEQAKQDAAQAEKDAKDAYDNASAAYNQAVIDYNAKVAEIQAELAEVNSGLQGAADAVLKASLESARAEYNAKLKDYNDAQAAYTAAVAKAEETADAAKTAAEAAMNWYVTPAQNAYNEAHQNTANAQAVLEGKQADAANTLQRVTDKYNADVANANTAYNAAMGKAESDYNTACGTAKTNYDNAVKASQANVDAKQAAYDAIVDETTTNAKAAQDKVVADKKKAYDDAQAKVDAKQKQVDDLKWYDYLYGKGEIYQIELADAKAKRDEAEDNWNKAKADDSYQTAVKNALANTAEAKALNQAKNDQTTNDANALTEYNTAIGNAGTAKTNAETAALNAKNAVINATPDKNADVIAANGAVDAAQAEVNRLAEIEAGKLAVLDDCGTTKAEYIGTLQGYLESKGAEDADLAAIEEEILNLMGSLQKDVADNITDYNTTELHQDQYAWAQEGVDGDTFLSWLADFFDAGEQLDQLRTRKAIDDKYGANFWSRLGNGAKLFSGLTSTDARIQKMMDLYEDALLIAEEKLAFNEALMAESDAEAAAARAASYAKEMSEALANAKDTLDEAENTLAAAKAKVDRAIELNLNVESAKVALANAEQAVKDAETIYNEVKDIVKKATEDAAYASKLAGFETKGASFYVRYPDLSVVPMDADSKPNTTENGSKTYTNLLGNIKLNGYSIGKQLPEESMTEAQFAKFLSKKDKQTAYFFDEAKMTVLEETLRAAYAGEGDFDGELSAIEAKAIDALQKKYGENLIVRVDNTPSKISGIDWNAFKYEPSDGFHVDGEALYVPMTIDVVYEFVTVDANPDVADVTEKTEPIHVVFDPDGGYLGTFSTGDDFKYTAPEYTDVDAQFDMTGWTNVTTSMDTNYSDHDTIVVTYSTSVDTTPAPQPSRRDRSRTVVTIADEEVPLGDAPEFDIPDGDVPLGDAPEFEIEDEEVPLGELPVTGGMGVGLFLLAGAALAGAGASLRRKDEE